MGVQNSNKSEFDQKRYSMSKLIVHLVFTAKDRHAFDYIAPHEILEAFDSASKKLDCEVVEFKAYNCCVHIIVRYPPKLAISVLVNCLKSTSSRKVNKAPGHSFWLRAYLACSAGDINMKSLTQYLESKKAR